jgi:hypothetical protein
MIRHPFTWTFWVAAGGGTVLYLAAMARAVDIVLNWSPEETGVDQLRRERRAEAVSLLASGALASLSVTALAGLVGIAWVWPALVPGAMCGTGVLQAMGAAGSRAMLFWAITLSILYVWRVLHRLDRDHPREPATQNGARLILAASPLLALSLISSWQALMHMDAVPTVSCCAAVYDRVLDGTADAHRVGLNPWFSLACQALLLILSLICVWRPQWPWAWWAAPLGIAWAAGSTVAVKHVWSAYVYQVLSHPCPWCLFLPDHHGIGFPVFGCMAVIVMESLAVATAHRARVQFTDLNRPATDRIRRAAIRILVCLAGFTLLTVGPAVAWRLRTGAWLDGSF